MTLQFTHNSDYPEEGTETKPHRSFGAPRITLCDRYKTNVIHDGTSMLVEVIVPSPRPTPSATKVRSNGGRVDDDSDSDDSDSDDSDSDTPTIESRHGYWMHRQLKPAIYGSVWSGVILKRLDQPFVNRNGETVVWEATRNRCAIKIYNRRHILESRGSAEDPMNEIAGMQFLLQYQRNRHTMYQDDQQGEEIMQSALDASFESNVMMPLGVYYNTTDIFNVMPYSDGGELFDVLDNRRTFPEAEARFWMHQILNGVETLQRAGICHRDMSLENLLTDRTGRVLIIDMGMCVKIPHVDSPFNPSAEDPRRFEDHRERQRCLISPDRACGKPYYMSPEIRRNKDPFDGHAVDMWALGPILFLMVAGFPPWEIADNSDERFYYFSNGYLRQTVDSWNLGLSPDLIDLLQRMFFLDARDRLGLEQVRAHPWMQGEMQPPPRNF